MVKQFLQHYRLVISTLSPVHIGCGQDYEPTNYIMDEGLLYTFDPVAALSSDAKARHELLEIVTKEQGDGVIQKIQNFFHTRKNELLPLYSRRMPVGDGVQAFYDKRVGKTTQAVNKLNIERTSFVLTDDRPILPGSSLKGAIRTALLDAIHGGKPLTSPKDAENQKNAWKTLSPLPTTLGDCLPQKQFECDPMRLIRVGDAYLSGAEECNEVFFAINRKSSGAEGKGPYQTLECLPPMGLASFAADISFLDPEQAQKYDDAQPNDKKNLPPKNRQWDHSFVAQKCNTYYTAHLQRELREMNGFLNPEWVKTIRQSIDGGELQRLLDSGKAFLLRVGRHSGAESVTLNGARHIYQPQSKQWVSKPTTVWLAARGIEQENNLLPFGWLLVELDDGQRRPLTETAPELAKLAQRFASDREDRLKKSDEKVADLREKEKTNRQKEAQQASLAAMSPNQRKIAEFRSAIAQTAIPQPVSGKLW